MHNNDDILMREGGYYSALKGKWHLGDASILNDNSQLTDLDAYGYSDWGGKELAPEGTGYRAKTRFAKFFNLPELIALFKESADLQTPDMLKLPVPEAEYENVTLKPSEAQKAMVASQADRAERLSTPKGDGTFNVYEDIRNKLIAKGVPPEEIAFIHDANTETRKAELFGKVRSGQVRFLLGSTQKMGAGTNVQDRLIALHHLDVPWRPSEEGHTQRYIRQKPSKINKYRAMQQPTVMIW